jgi:hypothetical protein
MRSLGHAIKCGDWAAMETLIRAGADLNQPGESDDPPPAILAADCFWFKAVYRLLEAGADYNLTSGGDFDLAAAIVWKCPASSSLWDENRHWRAKVIRFLTEKGVDWEAARRKCLKRRLGVIDIEAELKWDEENKEDAKAAVAKTLPAAPGSTGTPKGAEDMARVMQVMQRDDPGEFDKVMRSFVDRAVLGDIREMVALTSKVTIAQMGLEKLKEHYANDTIPALRLFPTVLDGGEVRYINEGNGTTGWAFKRVFASSDGRQARFQLIVLKEKGEIRVSSFGVW